ncbi:hypothetical protein ZWY2020_035732 [Hordeum vulgare]|nr:hypothetical protein ZWY2020_035732 [Hordeum vulgare]
MMFLKCQQGPRRPHRHLRKSTPPPSFFLMVQARKVVVSGDDAARGLVQLVDDHAVAELVMGAAADRGYTRKSRTPKSKKAVRVQRKANPSSRIWFVYKGNLICTRLAVKNLKAEDSFSKDSNIKQVSLVGKAGGEKWKSLSDAKKASYFTKAEQLKVGYTTPTRIRRVEAGEGV